MTDQIIDLQEAVMPGPRGYQGPRGEQGLPGVNAVSNDEAIAAYIASSGSQTSGALVERFAPRDPRDTMVVFGDSMTVCGSDTEHQWWSIVAARLGLRAVNYGHGGSGFVNKADGIDYDVELDRALTDAGVDRARVRYVFVDASTNDGGQSTVAPARADAWSRRVTAAYPNAQRVAFAGMCAANVRHAHNPSRLANNIRQFDAVGSVLAAQGWHVFTNSPFWLIYNRDLSMSDTLHPNDAGLQVIADYVLSGLQSGVYTAMSHSMGAVKPVKLTTLSDTGNRAMWMAGLIDSGFCGGDMADAIWPCKNGLRSSYAAWQAMPDTNQTVFYFYDLMVRLTADEVTKYTTTAYTLPTSVSGSTEDETISIGLDLPICPRPYPFMVTEAHGEAICRWSDGLDVRINNVPGVINAVIYQRTTAPMLDEPSTAKNWLWLHFDLLPINRMNLFAASTAGGPTNHGFSGVLGAWNLRQNLKTATDVLSISVSGRILQPIAGMWRP